MEVKARTKFVRMSPRKLRLIADIVRGKKVDFVLPQLKFLNKKGARIIEKLITCAKSNAENNNALDGSKLYIKKIYVDGGPSMKRHLPRAYGRASSIKKRLSNITVVVEEKT